MSNADARAGALPWRTDVQGLRALAVGLVILAHAGFPGFDAGVIGVDIFFVISGFLITGLMVAEYGRTGKVSIRDFYARRARRILPAATTVGVVTLLACWWLQPLASLKQHAVDAAWSATFLANVRFAMLDADYWATDEVSPFRHYWSLSVEEQFYLVWPLLLGLLVLKRARPLVWVLSLGGLSLAFSIWHTSDNPLQAYYSSPARAYELLAGAAVAVAAPALAALATWLRTILAVAGLVGVGGCLLFLEEASALPGWLALLPTLSAAALLAAGVGGTTVVGRLLSLQPLRYLGDISYSLYLWHWPVLVLLPSVAVVGNLGIEARTAVMLVTTLLLSALTYHLVERPLMSLQWLRRPARRSLMLWPASLAVIALVSVLAVQVAQGSFEKQQMEAKEFEAQNVELLRQQAAASPTAALTASVKAARKGAPIPSGLKLKALEKDVWFKNIPNSCQAWWKASTVDICEFGDTSAKATVVVLGDSHAGMWLPSLDALGKKQKFRVVPLVKHACSPYNYKQTLGGKNFPSCAKFRAWSQKQVRKLKPEAVVMASRGYQEIKPGAGQTKSQAWQAGVRDTVKKVRSSTDRVILLSDVPSRPVEPASCVTKRGATQKSCLSKSSGTRETESNAGTKKAAKAAGGKYVDVVPLVCQSRACPVVVNKKFVYFDRDHITRSWGIAVAETLGRRTGSLV